MDDDDGFVTVHITPAHAAASQPIKSKPNDVVPAIKPAAVVSTSAPTSKAGVNSDSGGTQRVSVDEDGFATVHVKKSNTTRDSGKGETDDISAKTRLTAAASTKFQSDGSKSKGPSIEAARTHFTQLLPKRVSDPLQPSGYRVCVPGEVRGADGEPAQFYSPFTADSKQIAEFGVGISLYFKTLKLLFVVLAICAAIMSVPIRANKKFNPPDGLTKSSLLGSTLGATPESLSYAGQGTPDIVITFIFLIIALSSGYLQSYFVGKVDKDNLTTSDYSVQVDNPPYTISDPDEYYRHFSAFGDVVLVTIAMNNGDLISTMAEKKVYEEGIEAQQRYKEIADGTMSAYKDQHQAGCCTKLLQCGGYSATLGYYQNLLKDANARLRSLVQKDYRPWRVFITFAKQKDQRECLKRTAVSYYRVVTGSAPGSEANFGGSLLNISRSPEPGDVLYYNSQYSRLNRWLRIVVSFSIATAALVLVFVIIRALRKAGTGATAIFIQIVNAILPAFVLFLTNYVERHVERSDEQMSILLKLVVVRCINSAVLIYLAAPGVEKFSAEHLAHIQSILIADAVTAPILRAVNIPKLLNEYYFAGQVATQEELNVLFTPADWSLAERYTDMLKTLFVGFFYAVPLPSGLIITCFTMLSTYVVDKYSLMRQWKQNIGLDESLSTVARYFLLIIVFAHVAVSKGYFADWPYSDPANTSKCNLFTCSIRPYMTQEQASLVRTYNGLDIAFFVIIVVWFVLFNFGGWVCSLFGKGDEQHAEHAHADVEKDTSYRELRSQSAFVPILEPVGHANPLIMSDVSKLPNQYLPIKRSRLFNAVDVDPANFSVVRKEELPSITDDKVLRSLFTQVCFYERKLVGAGKEFKPYVKPVFSAGSAMAPTPAVSIEMSASAPSTGSDTAAGAGANTGLPAGWTEKRDGAGKVYYSNSITKLTSWTRPT
jgi:hypothetical protein